MSEKKICGKYVNEEHTCTQPVDESGNHPGICAFIEVVDMPQSVEGEKVDLNGPIRIEDPLSILHFENRILRDRFIVLELNGRSYRLVLDEEEMEQPKPTTGTTESVDLPVAPQ